MGMRLVQWLSEFKVCRGNRGSVCPPRGQSTDSRALHQRTTCSQGTNKRMRGVAEPLAKQIFAWRHARGGSHTR